VAEPADATRLLRYGTRMRTLILTSAMLSTACNGPDSGPGPDTDGDSDAGSSPVPFVGDARLSAEALRVHLQALQDIADDHDGHRAVGSSGYAASVAYVQDAIAAWGLDSRLDPFDVTDWTALSADVTVGDTPIDDGPVLLQWSPGGSVTAEVVAVDVTIPAPATPNTSTSGCEADDFADFPAGAIALVQRGTCTFTDKASNAEAAGASAVLVFNEGQSGRTDAVEGALDGEGAVEIPVLGLSYDDGVALAQDATATVEAQVEVQRTPSQSVLVDIPGTGSGDGWWVVGAHLDSVPAGPGINDNGTGVALLLQLARILVEEGPRVDGVRLAFWGAEEIGLVGSLAYVRGLPEDAVILGNLNFDMIGSPNPARFVYDGDGSTFGVPQGLPVPGENADIEQAFVDHLRARDLAVDFVPYDGRSDYLGFALAGVPTGGTFTGAEQPMPLDVAKAHDGEAGTAYDPCYHRECDTLDNVDFDVLVEMSEAAADVLFQLADVPGAEARRRWRRLGAVDAPVWSPRSCGHAEHVVR